MDQRQKYIQGALTVLVVVLFFVGGSLAKLSSSKASSSEANVAASLFFSANQSSGISTTNSSSIVPTGVTLPVENRENSSQYSFINPLLFVENDKKMFSEYVALNLRLNSYVQQAVNSGKANSISIYYRDMDSGHWTGINEDKLYEPSSMLKVVVMISYLKKAGIKSSQGTSSIESVLSDQLYYPGVNTAGQYYPQTNSMPAGMYSAKELINDMIVNSDNVALSALMANDKDIFQQVYHDFRLPNVPSDASTDYMTAKSYSVVFRTLFNSTYLPWDVSERALQLLASTTFTKGLVAGVPDGTVVAHKFGEHTDVTQDGKVLRHELHDCGIIYYPNRPYLLCVMTSGQDFTKLESVISDISKIGYQYTSGLPVPAKN